MRKTKQMIYEEYPEWMKILRRKNFRSYLIEIAKRGDGNEIYHIIGDKYYGELLWKRDNHVNPKDEEFIGSLHVKKL